MGAPTPVVAACRVGPAVAIFPQRRPGLTDQSLWNADVLGVPLDGVWGERLAALSWSGLTTRNCRLHPLGGEEHRQGSLGEPEVADLLAAERG